MKLRNLVLGAVLSLPLLALADGGSSNSFAGAYAGLGLGGTALTETMDNASTVEGTVTGITGTSSGSVDAGVMGVNGSVFGGYNFDLGSNWLVGLQAEYDYNSAKGSASSTSSLDYASTIIATTATVNFKLQQSYGLDANLGYLLTSDSLLYVGAGWTQGKGKMNGTLTTDYDTATETDSLNYSKTVNGIKGIVGAQQSLASNMSVREEMSYTQFSNLSTTVSQTAYPTPVGPEVATSTVSAKLHFLTASLDFVYGFNI